MNPTQIQMIAALLRTVATAVANNTRDKATIRQITDYVGLGATLIETGTDAMASMRELTENVQRMVTENRGPLPEELEALKERSNQAHRRIQDAAAKGRTQPPLDENPDGIDNAVEDAHAGDDDTVDRTENAPTVSESTTRREL
jgi:hypothetical protein